MPRSTPSPQQRRQVFELLLREAWAAGLQQDALERGAEAACERWGLGKTLAVRLVTDALSYEPPKGLPLALRLRLKDPHPADPLDGWATALGTILVDASFMPPYDPEDLDPEARAVLAFRADATSTKTDFLKRARTALASWWDKTVEPERQKAPDYVQRKRELEDLLLGVRGYLAWSLAAGEWSGSADGAAADRQTRAGAVFVDLWEPDLDPDARARRIDSVADRVQDDVEKVRAYLAEP